LQEVRVLAEFGVVLFGAVEGGEGVGVPEMPADALRRRNLVRLAIHVAIGVAQPLVPQALPGEDFGILDEDSPEGDKRPVGGTLAGPHRRDPVLERAVPAPRAIDVDAGLPRRIDTMRAEAADGRGIAAAAVPV